MVADVFEHVANGMDWETIIEEWAVGKLTRKAIAEAIRLGRHEALISHTPELMQETARS
ncbi:protein containing DUF433 [Candidatus Brocadia sinica JPN1]|uniref:Protein containing DUF433 n=1 Tax=Candidatus Brocadia sinica JPN1 TaxID=1197129 RepID=A0ABQ0JUU5_9BACT|nr:protein containing DUF433 [Candidatus Brocadia sinica JPN1]GIK13932.1 MAG: hypothetical protein BroJett002_26390 [Candidatus Brocadia sinica]GJQ16852.1 MAG: hypothetical protein HBSIN01_08110 [Candidatus Brocadia sinica]